MRLLKCETDGNFTLTKNYLSDPPHPYAVLSHTWGEDDDEVHFEDMRDGSAEHKPGYEKLRFCGSQASRDGLMHFWIDTCCINKADSSELQEAINSMFHFYQSAAKCYVYLSDLSTRKIESKASWEPKFRSSKWFTRGWTLQELLAPATVEFFSREGYLLGNKKSLEREISKRTGILLDALKGLPLSRFSIDERIRWQEERETTRPEDKAYCLLGVFGIHMVLIYGEGRENAFRRLRKEIQETSAAIRHHQITLSSQLTTNRASCTFETTQFVVRAGVEPFLHFNNEQAIRFHYQPDGNFLIYRGIGYWAWSSGKGEENNGDKLYFEGDGNLVAYDRQGDAIWSTGTSGNENAKLILSSAEPFVEIFSANGTRIFSSSND